MGDEIGGGAGPPRPTIRTVLLVLVEAAAVVAGVVSLRRGVEPVQVRPPASPPAGRRRPLAQRPRRRPLHHLLSTGAPPTRQ